MPYSRSLGVVYVAIPKTGTTSFTRALRQLQASAGGELELVKDTVTPEFRRRYRLDEIGDPRPGRAKHLSALQLRYILGEDEFTRCTRLSVVRNPWARMVSRYFFTHLSSEPDAADKLRRGTSRKFHDLEFEAWLERRRKRQRRSGERNSQLEKLTDRRGELLVDHVGRLERVQETLDWLTARLGMEPIAMPHVNGTRKGRYARFYSAATRELVAEMCREDIEFFDYQFEEEPGTGD